MDQILSFDVSHEFLDMLIRFGISTLFAWIIVDRMYFKKSTRRDFYFTFMLSSIAIFFIVFFMIFVLEDMKTKTSIGIGIGLFGIFSIMRYRTDAMPVREMTYLFLLVALAVVNAIANSMSIVELVLTNLIVVVSIAMCEWHLGTGHSKLIQYDRIELIVPERRQELIDDLEKRTGLKIEQVSVGAIDFLRDMAIVKIFYKSEHSSGEEEINHMTKLPKQQWESSDD